MNFTVRFVSPGLKDLFNFDVMGTVNLGLIQRLEKRLGYKVPIGCIDKNIQTRCLYEYNLVISRDVAEKSGLFLEASFIQIDVPEKYLEACTSTYARREGKEIVFVKTINPNKLLKWWIDKGFPVKF